jgi:hypothetical protein
MSAHGRMSDPQKASRIQEAEMDNARLRNLVIQLLLDKIELEERLTNAKRRRANEP